MTADILGPGRLVYYDGTPPAEACVMNSVQRRTLRTGWRDVGVGIEGTDFAHLSHMAERSQ